MKKYWPFLKISGGILLMAYSWLFAVYTIIQAVLFIAIVFGKVAPSDSALENSLRWFLSHPTVILIFLILTIPGFLISFRANIIAWRDKRNNLYLTDSR